ncbi:reverse transcriptase domain-containing protein [Tanacetum coccineum]
MFRIKLENPRSATTLRVQNTKRKRGTPKETKVRGEGTEEYSIGWEARKRVCLHTRKAATRVLAQEKRNPSPENVTMKERVHEGHRCSLKVKTSGGHWKSKSKKQRSSIEEDDLSQPWVKRWAMPTWCHMFNSTLTRSARVWFDDLPRESVDSYDDLKKAFLANFLQQKKCIKDPVEIHHIKQRDGESTEDFVQRFKAESRHVKGAPECMRISGFMHGITNPELIKRLHDNIPKLVDEMMRVTTTFLSGEVAASNQVRKKTLLAWKQQEAGRKQNFERRGDFRNQQRSERRRDKFTLLTKSPKEILALDKGKFKTPPPMTTPVEKRNNNKFCEFHGEVGHNTDKCMHLRRQIEELIKAGKLLHVIKELKQGSGKDQPKASNKGETSGKDKPLAILMVQPWQRVAKQRITQSFSPNPEISFPPLGDEEGTEGPMIIEAEIGGHFIHRIYVDGGSASEILYEHCFNRLRPEVKNQMVPATAPLIGFSRDIIWLIGQILLPVKIGDAEHSTSTWMNFVVVRSPSPYNGVIGRPGVRKIQAVPSIAHRMLKFPVLGGILILQSSKIIPLECTIISGSEAHPSSVTQVAEERIRVAIHPEYSEQTIEIGSTLTEEGRKALCELLRRNLDIFAWKPEDMTGVPQHLAEHRLNVREGCLPVRQKKRSQTPERNKAIQEEVSKLVDAGIMKEVHYHSWLSNPIMVKKSMTTAGGYKAFQKQIGRNLEVYVDDLVIKSRTEQEIMRDIEETFRTLREINMKLNPKKCTFRVEEGMFLGYKLNTKGIKVCPDKVEAVLSLPSPKCLKDVQKLNGKLANLNRFLSKSAEKSLPFFKTLKKCTKKSDFQWTTEAEVAFKEMKRLIAELSMLTAPMEKDELIVFLLAAKEAGIDIAGPFPKGLGKVKFLIGAIDYFTKWIEANPVATITGITRSKIGVKSYASASALPPSSIHKPMDSWKEQTEAWEQECRHDWMKEERIGSKKSHMTAEIETVQNDEALEINLDLLEERREQAAIREARSKAKMEKYYNSKVRNTSFKPGDLMYQNNDASHAKDSRKLGPKWEGPYEVMEALGKGAYKLRDRNGELLP